MLGNTTFHIAIIGAAGYTGGEALELLLDHPRFTVAIAQSNSQAGKAVWEVHPRLRGRTQLVFQSEVESSDIEIDAWILCTGHGRAKAFVEEYATAAEGKRIVDLSTDFRQNGPHGFVYGLPEAFAKTIATATRVANPGCFATAIQLALLPLAERRPPPKPRRRHRRHREHGRRPGPEPHDALQLARRQPERLQTLRPPAPRRDPPDLAPPRQRRRRYPTPRPLHAHPGRLRARHLLRHADRRPSFRKNRPTSSSPPSTETEASPSP